MNYCILGAGAWGTALAIHIARCDQSVTLVPRRLEQALALAGTRQNKEYLPNFTLDSNIQIASETLPAIMSADVIFFACPMVGLRELCTTVAACQDDAWNLTCLVSLCKGLEPTTLLRPAEIIRAVLPDFSHAALSGPSFAHEVAAGQPTAVTLACDNEHVIGQRIQEEISDTALRIYLSDDLTGVELGGCLKNIYAIGAGIADGLKLGQNAKAAFMTRALREMLDIGRAIGGNPKTFFGLSGFGDLIATCNGASSRNRGFGEAIGHGLTPETLLNGRKTVIEGYWATKSFYELVQREKLNAPILQELHAVLYQNKSPKAAIVSLMSRELKEEN